MQLIEPAVAFLHEHLVQRAHTAETVRTYAEILVDWFDALEHNGIHWGEADAVDLVAYRNRMLSTPSPRLDLIVFGRSTTGFAASCASICHALGRSRQGQWPNPSIERTSQRPLRALCAADHVER
jgi:hypothetical protein